VTVGLSVHGYSMLPTSVTRMGHLATFDSPTVDTHNFIPCLQYGNLYSNRVWIPWWLFWRL